MTIREQMTYGLPPDSEHPNTRLTDQQILENYYKQNST